MEQNLIRSGAFTREELDEWKREWDFWRGYFTALKPKNKTWILTNYEYKQAEKRKENKK